VAFGSRPVETAWMTVVGVVADVRYAQATAPDEPQIYQAHGQSASREMAVVVRTTSDPMALLKPAAAIVAAIDSKIPVYDIASLEDVEGRAIAGTRFTLWLFSMFAAAALVLAAAGIYGVIAFAVGRRHRELGVRLALGARPVDISRLVVGEAMTLVVIGLTAGVVLAISVTRGLDGLVYGVATVDPATYIVVTVMLAAAGWAACAVPAWRASRVDPATVLRGD
jgi:ABC-type antimicrobial peptide transport system permease subunit